MKHRYLEVTYRKGTPIAAYLDLPRDLGTRSARTEDAGHGLRVDYDQNGNPIGVELTAPSLATAERLNELMQKLGQALLQSQEWAPLQAARGGVLKRVLGRRVNDDRDDGACEVAGHLREPPVFAVGGLVGAASVPA